MWCLVAFGLLCFAFAALLVALVVAGRASDARALARLIPDCVVLLTRLARDPSLPRSTRWLVAGAVAYLALPIDIIPDVLPVIGQLDDALLVAWVLRRIVRAAGTSCVTRHWPGPPESLRVVTGLAGIRGATP